MIAQELEVSLHMAFVEAARSSTSSSRSSTCCSRCSTTRPPRGPEKGLRRRPGRAARCPLRLHPGAHAAASRRTRTPTRSRRRLPARDPARDPARPVLRQEGGHRRQRAGGDLRREGIARRLLPEPAGRHAPRRRQLHRARHHQDAAAEAGEAGSQGGDEGGNESQGALDAYTLNLNALAKSGKIDPLIGRDHELERVIQVLCRRRKNNPLLVGEAGVGKTAIAGRAGAPHQRRRRAGAAARRPGVFARHGRAAAGTASTAATSSSG